MRRLALRPVGTSRYNLRKNQKDACLCTAECVVEILRMAGHNDRADELEQRFLGFIKQSGAKPMIHSSPGGAGETVMGDRCHSVVAEELLGLAHTHQGGAHEAV
jgi:hypothetical protein